MEKGISLYNITSKFIELFNNAEEELITPEELETMGNELALELKNKSTSIVAFDRTLEAQENAINVELERLKLMKDRISKRREKFKNYVKENMETLELQKIETELGTISIAKNPASVEIYDESLVPAEYKKEKVTIIVDKTKIKEALKNGENVKGAKLIEDKTSLRIK